MSILGLLILTSLFYANLRIMSEPFGSLGDLPNPDCILVLGAGVQGQRPSFVLEDRLKVALRLFQEGRSKRILVSGDHASLDYDETNVMRGWLERHGVPSEAIFMDHAGLDTYSSMTRAALVFGVRSALVVTQEFHLSRALYIGRAKAMSLVGVPSDLRHYRKIRRFKAREYLAREKALFDVLRNRVPKFLGSPIDLQGSGIVTHDDRAGQRPEPAFED